jgi:integrase
MMLVASGITAQPAMVDWHANSIRLEKRQTKGKQSRIAPMYGDLRAWLEAAYKVRDPDCLTIVAYRGTSVSETKTAWTSARKRAGDPDVLIHDLRRTAVRNMVRAGVSEKQAMLISGHKTRSVFDRYDIIDERDTELAGQKVAHFETEEKVRREVRRVGPETAPEGGEGNAYKV